jgi:O-antigen ligase
LILLLNPLTIVLFKSLSKVESSLSYFSRLNFYEDVWKTFLKNPITGIGLGNLGYYSKFQITDSVASAHNIILGMLGETGIVGAAFFITMLVYTVILSFKNYIKEKNERIKILLWSFLSAIIGALVHSMMEPNIEGFQFSIMFWSCLAVSYRLSGLSDENKILLVNISSRLKSYQGKYFQSKAEKY